MTIHLYFSLIPEALIASMLSPEEFGQYYSTGHQFKSKGQAIFFEVDPTFRHEFFNIDEGFKRCTPHPDRLDTTSHIPTNFANPNNHLIYQSPLSC